jgi:hypothetical protein
MERLKSKSGNLKNVLTIIFVAICIAVVASAGLLRSKITVDQNVAADELFARNYNITSGDIIRQACELLGKPYAKSGNGKGAMDPYVEEPELLSPNQIGTYGIDCSGLIYWTLASLGQQTENFAINTPVPVDTYHWLRYNNGSTDLYWKECSNNPYYYGVGNVSAYDYTKINGKTVKLYKVEERIGEKRYYEFGANKQYLPAGIIVISNAKALVGYTPKDLGFSDTDTHVIQDNEIEDHSWITLGYLDTTDPNEVKRILVEMGVPEASLITER